MSAVHSSVPVVYQNGQPVNTQWSNQPISRQHLGLISQAYSLQAKIADDGKALAAAKNAANDAKAGLSAANQKIATGHAKIAEAQAQRAAGDAKIALGMAKIAEADRKLAELAEQKKAIAQQREANAKKREDLINKLILLKSQGKYDGPIPPLKK